MAWQHPHTPVAQRGDTLHFTAPRRLVAVSVGMTAPFFGTPASGQLFGDLRWQVAAPTGEGDFLVRRWGHPQGASLRLRWLDPPFRRGG